MSKQSGTNYDNRPSSNQPPSQQTGFRFGLMLYFLPFVALVATGFFMLGRKTLKPLTPVQPVVNVYPSDVGTIRLQEGPWGDLEYLPISIAAPTELLNVRNTEETPVRWFFKGYPMTNWLNC